MSDAHPVRFAQPSATGNPLVPREPHARPWSQPPHVDEPIMDAARAPLSAYLSHQGPSWSVLRKIGMFVWLHVLRPLLTIAVWVAALRYAWPYVLDAPAQPHTLRLLWLYAAIITVIFCLMLTAAPLRRRQQRRATAIQPDDSSLMALADYIALPPAQLGLYQQAKRLFVQHGPQGHMSAAMTSFPGTQPQ